MLKLKEERGYILVAVLLIFTVIAVIGLSLVTLSYHSVQTSTTERQNQSAYYIAEAGINYQLEKIKNEVKQAEKAIDEVFRELRKREAREAEYKMEIDKTRQQLHKKIIDDSFFEDDYRDYFEPINEVEPRAVFDIEGEKFDEYDEYTLWSKGYVDDQSRTVMAVFRIGWDLEIEEIVHPAPEQPSTGDLPSFAVFTNEEISLTGSNVVYGDVGTTSSNKNSIKMIGSARIVGNQYVPATDEGGNPLELKQLPDFPEFPAYECPNISLINNNCDMSVRGSSNVTWEMTQDAEINRLNKSGSGVLTIDVGDEDRDLVLTEFSMSGSGKINVKGNGTLNLYVKNGFNISGSGKLNNSSHANKLNIFYKGNRDISLSGSQQVNGSIFVDSADIKVTGSASINGNIFSNGNSVTVRGSAQMNSQLIIAPNAKVTKTGSTTFYGRVIADSFKSSGSGAIWYVDCMDSNHQTKFHFVCPQSVLDGPISPAALEMGSGDSGGSGGQPPSSGRIEVIVEGEGLNIGITQPIREEPR